MSIFGDTEVVVMGAQGNRTSPKVEYEKVETRWKSDEKVDGILTTK